MNPYIHFSKKELEAINLSDIHIYRIFPFDRFIDLITQSSNVLVQPQLWEDPYENPLKGIITDPKTATQFSIPLFERVFAQCWSLHDQSDAMWRIYSPDKKGVLVKVKADNLLSSLASAPEIKISSHQRLFLGKVLYKTQINLKKVFENNTYIKTILRKPLMKPPIAAAKSLLYKRDSFKHEEEVRIIFINHVLDDAKPKISKFTINPKSLIESVTLDPRLENVDYKRQKDIIKAVGYSGGISKSSLYKLPTLNLQAPGHFR